MFVCTRMWGRAREILADYLWQIFPDAAYWMVSRVLWIDSFISRREYITQFEIQFQLISSKHSSFQGLCARVFLVQPR